MLRLDMSSALQTVANEPKAEVGVAADDASLGVQRCPTPPRFAPTTTREHRDVQVRQPHVGRQTLQYATPGPQEQSIREWVAVERHPAHAWRRRQLGQSADALRAMSRNEAVRMDMGGAGKTCRVHDGVPHSRRHDRRGTGLGRHGSHSQQGVAPHARQKQGLKVGSTPRPRLGPSFRRDVDEEDGLTQAPEEDHPA